MRLLALTVLAASLLGQDRSQMAQQFAEGRLKVWQQRLSLESWRVSVELARAKDLRPKTVGQVEAQYPIRTAVIRVLSPADHGLPDDKMLALVESVVVHELIHLTLIPLRGERPNEREEERAVQHITDALLPQNDDGHPSNTDHR